MLNMWHASACPVLMETPVNTDEHRWERSGFICVHLCSSVFQNAAASNCLKAPGNDPQRDSVNESCLQSANIFRIGTPMNTDQHRWERTRFIGVHRCSSVSENSQTSNCLKAPGKDVPRDSVNESRLQSVIIFRIGTPINTEEHRRVGLGFIRVHLCPSVANDSRAPYAR
jgi:hypothetical protein